MIADDCPAGQIMEVILTMNNGDQYIVRPNGIGDTIIGSHAHKVMFGLMEKERANNSSNVYKFSMHDKIKWILNNSETII